MNRQQESLKHKKSVAGNRSLRAHKRDVERKIHRDETLSRHRKLSAMSPLKEKVSNLKQDVTGKVVNRVLDGYLGSQHIFCLDI